jgi:hypothetical protein
VYFSKLRLKSSTIQKAHKRGKAAGEIALVFLYKVATGESLDKLRFKNFHRKFVVSKTFVDLQVLHLH